MGGATLLHLAMGHLRNLLTQLDQRMARDISTVGLYGLCLLSAEMARCDRARDDRSLSASQLGRLLLASLAPGVHDNACAHSQARGIGAERHTLAGLLQGLDRHLSRTTGRVEPLH
jgi:hypothetical protein